MPTKIALSPHLQQDKERTSTESPGIATSRKQFSATSSNLSPRIDKPYSSTTGVGDWEELVDAPSGRVFFFSELQQLSKWALPLDTLGRNADERKHLSGWCVHVDPSSQKKFFAHEEKNKAQWALPESLALLVKDAQYLKEKRSMAVQNQKVHSRNRPQTSDALPKEAPTMRRMTLRMLVQKLTLDKVICDREAFQAFQVFAGTFHAEENVLFYCVVEAFSKRGSKAVGVLGLDDLAKTKHQGLPRTQSHLNQINLDTKRADRMGTTIEKVQMIREANAIYSRFLCAGASDWVCVDQKIVDDVQCAISACKDDPKNPLDRSLFAKAQHYVYKNLEHDLLPRFVKAALTRPMDERDANSADDECNSGSKKISSVSVMDSHFNPKHGPFIVDEVLRHHLLQLQKKPQGVVTSLMSTANAYRSLYPSPRYAIEGRAGSGLSPNSLTEPDGGSTVALEASDRVLAKPDGFDRKSVAYGTRSIRNPFGTGSIRALSIDFRRSSASARPSIASKINEASSMERAAPPPAAVGRPVRARTRSKSDGDINEDLLTAIGMDQINLDMEFDVPEQ